MVPEKMQTWNSQLNAWGCIDISTNLWLPKHRIGRDQRYEIEVNLEWPNMVWMLSVLLRDHITLFSIHGEHYTKVNMR